MDDNKAALKLGDNLSAHERARSRNTHISPATVKSVDLTNGVMEVELSSRDIIKIPLGEKANKSGNIDVAIPKEGDTIWFYQDATVKGEKFGAEPSRDFEFIFQDPQVEKNTDISESVLIPPIKPGERQIRVAKGSSINMSGSLKLQDAALNEIILDSDEDAIRISTNRIEKNLYNSELRMGLTTRFAPNSKFSNSFDKNSQFGTESIFYDTIMRDPTTGEPMTEFSVFLGKKLKKTIPDIADYLKGSNNDLEFENNFDDDIGKDAEPDIQFQLSDKGVMDVTGDTFPTLLFKRLNMLLKIADKCTFEINTDGSLQLGQKTSAGGLSGLAMSLGPSKDITLGLVKGNRLNLGNSGDVTLQNHDNASLSLLANNDWSIANKNVYIFAKEKGEDNDSSLVISHNQSGEETMLIRSKDSELEILGGGVALNMSSDPLNSKFQVSASKIYLGNTPLFTAINGEPFLAMYDVHFHLLFGLPLIFPVGISMAPLSPIAATTKILSSSVKLT